MTGEPRISVRAHFERFPATVKGAFVIRGEDRDPHQVVFREARVVQVGGHGGRRLSMAPATLDVAPRHDVFVPFELTVSDLDSGWYALECDLDVDGQPGTLPCERRFVVAWPRATIRRGTVRVGKKVALGKGASVRVEQVECGGDSIKVHLVASPPGPVNIRLTADGSRVEVLDAEFDPDSGRGRVTAYPLLRGHRSLHIDFPAGRGRAGASGAGIDVRLP